VTRLRASRQGTLLAGDIGNAVTAEGVVLFDISSGAARNLTPRGRQIGFTTWSPDGRWIAAEGRLSDRDTVVLLDVATGAVRTLVDVPGRSWPHDWAPDNDRIVFAGERSGLWNIYWVSRSSGKVQQLTHFDAPSEYVRYPAWSPRNDQVVFKHTTSGASIFVTDFIR
jgi:Tol biopolymer transport system component